MRDNSSNKQQELINSIPSKIVFSNFINAIKSLGTIEKYSYNFLQYTQYLHIDSHNSWSFETGCKNKWKRYYYLYYENERRKFSYSSMKVMLSSLFLFFDMNDITFNTRKIHRYLWEHIKTVKDRAYTREEIKKLIDACDLKYKL